ncbi:MAG TPA: GIY-YIG nuclease family protein [Vicinamibacterales bacterium]
MTVNYEVMGSGTTLVAAYRPGHFVYIVRCADGTLYTGYARDPHAREIAHNTGRGAKYTSGRRPVTLVHVERYRTKGRALRREVEIKKWSRQRKEALCTLTRTVAR